MRREMLFAGLAGAMMLGGMALPPALAQNAPGPAETALTSQQDTTLARRLLMHSIGANNDIVHDILDGTLPMDDLELRGRLQSIGAALYAMPNLYRAEANPYSEEAEKADALHVSLANDKVWEDFTTFRDLSYAAFFKAQEAADATPDQMLARVEELEVMCDSCHETYRTPFEYFDFDRIEDFLTE